MCERITSSRKRYTNNSSGPSALMRRGTPPPYGALLCTPGVGRTERVFECLVDLETGKCGYRRVSWRGPSEQGVSYAGLGGAARRGMALGVVVRTGGRARADALAQARVRARGVRVVLVEPRPLGRRRSASRQKEWHLGHGRRCGAATRTHVWSQPRAVLKVG